MLDFSPGEMLLAFKEMRRSAVGEKGEQGGIDSLYWKELEIVFCAP